MDRAGISVKPQAIRLGLGVGAAGLLHGVGDGLGRGLGRRLGWLKQQVRLWVARERQRNYLAHLSSRDLMDMGLTRDDVEREVNKVFWQA